MKFNLYIPSEKVKKHWEEYAEKDGRSLSQFIREAVKDRIRKMREDETSGFGGTT